MGGVTISISLSKKTFFYSIIFIKLVLTLTDSFNTVLQTLFVFPKIKLILVTQLKSYKIENVHNRGYGPLAGYGQPPPGGIL